MKWKVCGMKFEKNIFEVAELKPDYMGFIFYEKSPRFVGKDFKMPEISKGIKKVGVFVNESVEEILACVKKQNLQFVQLHGNETVAYCNELKNKNVSIIKAFGIDEEFNFTQLPTYEKYCDYFLFDIKTSKYGGSGKKFDWNILQKYEGEKLFFLSGGIDLEAASFLSESTINKALYAMDVNSKFEIMPGLKNCQTLKKLQQCIK
ncbi:MAG: phosphoribosylanthranilate isomerase [Bacteroidia bacterium]